MTKTYTIETRTSYVSATADPANLVHKDAFDINAALQEVEVEVTNTETNLTFATAEDAHAYAEKNLVSIEHSNSELFELTFAQVWEVELDEDGEAVEYSMITDVFPKYVEYAHMLATMVVNACMGDEDVMTIQGQKFDGIQDFNNWYCATEKLCDLFYEYMLGINPSIVVTSDEANFIFDK